MPPSTMRKTVLQTTAIYVAIELISHHAGNGIFENVFANPGVMNFTGVLMNSTTPVHPFDYKSKAELDEDFLAGVTVTEITDDTTEETSTADLTINVPGFNATALNQTILAAQERKQRREREEPFYGKGLLIDAFTWLILCTLQYCWLIGLERALPARSRQRDFTTQEKSELSEGREEEIVKKWIAQGRVRRASLNWCNTLLKWILSVTVGRVWWFAVMHVVRRALDLESPSMIWEGMVWGVTINYIGYFATITPLAELIGFITIPAHKQSVLIAGADLATEVFLLTLLRKFATWAIETESMQEVLRDMTQGLIESREKEEFFGLRNEL